jgi:hypothetical protein
MAMNLVRIGKIIINFDQVTEILQGEAAGPNPESLIVHFGSDRKHTFKGDDAEALRAFLDRTTKNAVSPQKDLEYK